MTANMKSINFESDLYQILKDMFLPYMSPHHLNAKVVDEKTLTGLFGQDITGIDILCVLGDDFYVAIQCKQSRASCIRDMTHFLYCCNSIRNVQMKNSNKKIYIYKIWASSYEPSKPAMAAAEREDVKVVCDPIQFTLIERIKQRIYMLYNEYQTEYNKDNYMIM